MKTLKNFEVPQKKRGLEKAEKDKNSWWRCFCWKKDENDDNDEGSSKIKYDEEYSEKLAIDLCCSLHIEEPHPSMYGFEGYVIFFENGIEMLQNVGLDVKNFLFKGSKLRNTDFALGVVIYTGAETKVQNNSGKPRLKHTRLRNRLDGVIVLVFMLQILLSVFCCFGRDLILLGTNSDFSQWLEESD